jgi:histidyl-tRNA synthetase
LETPALEYAEILLGKYGKEGDKLMYRFEDRGGRKIAMRYDQTVPLARVVSEHQNSLPMPFKRYQIQPVWRADNTQRGRFREFLQCDIDTVGTDSILADAEIIVIVAKSFEALGFRDFKILLNDRSIFASLPRDAIVTIDKLKKIGREAVVQELLAKKVANSEDAILSILQSIESKGPTDRLKEVSVYLSKFGVDPSKYEFCPTLARGLDYYTSLIFEVEISKYSAGSVCGGGRYDGLIGQFAKKRVPAVGCAFGFDRIVEAMEEQKLFPSNLPGQTKVLVTIFNPDYADYSIEICSRLRQSNINSALWLDAAVKIEKQLKYADQKGIPFVIIFGPEEKEKNVITLKNMKTRKQESVSLTDLVEKINETV